MSFSISAQAGEWRAVLERAGFLGTLAAGASYEFVPEHAAYRYSRWNTKVFGNDWRPLQLGVFAVYALNNERFFIKSPDKYPYPDYYDETAIRYGAEFGTTFTFMPSRIGIGYHIRIFDNGIIAMFNNSNRDIQYYISSGISLQYLF